MNTGPANDNLDQRQRQRVLEIAESLEFLAVNVHPKLAIRIVHVAAGEAIRHDT
jgi:hypothetical protein